MEDANGARAVRCRKCTALLGIETGKGVHFRYKGFDVVARGAVTVLCRRCRALTELTTPTAGEG
jgi:phage FluMu protein Com